MAHPNRPNRGVTLVKLLGVLLVTGVLSAGVLVPVIGGVGLTGKAEADRFLDTDCTLQDTSPSTKTTLYASDGKTVLAQFFSQNRVPVTLDKIPLFMQRALVDTEDRRFYDHHGVDARGLLRAAVNNSESGDTQGGSTLTMQYVKQLRYYNATNDAERDAAIDQNVERKIQDAKCALDLEKQDTAKLGSETAAKNQILQNYFNIAFFGQNSYGVQAAAKTYFNKDVSKLNLAEAAMIVGLVQAPTQYDPFNNPDQAIARRNLVIDNLYAAGHARLKDAQEAKKAPLGLSAKVPPPVAMGCSYTGILNAGFFCDYAQAYLESHGISEDVLLRAGLSITTTLDAGLQTSGQQAVWTGDSDNRGGPFLPTSASSLVMPSIDPRNGNVTTMITSRHYTNPNDPNAPNDPNQTSVPLFTTATAGAGSTYKYFTTLTAMAAGVDPTYTLTAGAPYTTKNCPKDYDPNSGTYKSYVARNAGSYAATLPLEKALYESSNTYFVGMEDMLFNCYTRPIADTAVSLGMDAIADKTKSGGLEQVATFTLGQEGTSPLALAGAYATVANDGRYCPPSPITAVKDQTGKDITATLKKPGCVQRVAPQVAREVVQMLSRDTDTNGGTAYGVFNANGWYGDGGSIVASKTGTNNATGADGLDNGQNSAIWFVGLTPTLVSSAAVFNYKSPNTTISGLPGYNDGYASNDAFGAAAGAYWLKAYGPMLKANPWTWPSPESTPGYSVPDITGKTPAEATAILAGAGFKANILPYTCGSRQSAGTLIGYNPKIATPGSTISACVSNGKAPAGGGGGTTFGGGGFGGGNGNGNGNGNNGGGGGNTGAPAAPGNGGAPGNGNGGAPGNGGGTTVGDGGRPGGR